LSAETCRGISFQHRLGQRIRFFQVTIEQLCRHQRMLDKPDVRIPG
jgi:hypothetical protein